MKEGPQWYAVHTLSRHEKLVKTFLDGLRLETFLPLRCEQRGRKDVELVVITGYVFVRCVMTAKIRATIKRATGVCNLVSIGDKPCVIPEGQIESLKLAWTAGKPEPHPYISNGERVQIVRGPFVGVKGYFARFKGQDKVVITIDYVDRAVQVDIDSKDVQRIA